MRDEFPIFYDKSGKRWKFTKLFLAVFFVTACTSIVMLMILALRKAEIPASHHAASSIPGDRLPVESRSPSQLAYSLPKDIPVIGTGVFLRVSQVHQVNNQAVLADVYSGYQKKILSSQEKKVIGQHKYVIERYGSKPGKHIVLTFDDGPHPIYTPQILDVLSAEGAHSTFFPIGANVVKYPEIAERMTREGHDVANHTFSHADLDLTGNEQARQEINQTQRIIRSVTGVDSALFRIPYGGNDDESVIDDKRAILEAQSLGYVLASYDIDSNDWEFDDMSQIKMPELDGTDKVVLMHDGGGDRTKTVAYLQSLIQAAKAEGYTFTSLSRLHSEYKLNATINPSIADDAAFYAANASIVWPKQIIHVLFFTSVFLAFFSIVVAIILAELQLIFHKPRRRHNGYYPLVSVIIPAYNEEKVLGKTVKSVLRSQYRNLEVIIIDDGSKDRTWEITKELRSDPRIRGLHQRNRGKSSAVNRGIKVSRGSIFISIDADTIFLPNTISKMVRFFHDPEIGGVAGVVKVGNVNSWITRWQALEYITSISIERASQAFMKSIVIAPGACSAWRKHAVKKAGGYSAATMAEDCDLTLAVHRAGYQIVQDMSAFAYTESPETLRDLAKQRFRWIFGTIQAFWKHRNMIFNYRYGWLGCFFIPKAILGIMMQLIFTPLLLLVAISNIISGNLSVILLYAAVSFLILVITAAIGLLLARERLTYLIATPAFRIVYSPLRSILLYATALAVLGGMEISWNKVVRSGSAVIR